MQDSRRPYEDEAQALGAMEAWLRDARPAAPPDLAATVMRAIASEDAARGAGRTRFSISRWALPRAARIWAPIAAAAAIVLFLSLPGERPELPTDDRAAPGGGAPSEVAGAPGVPAAAGPDSVPCVFQIAAGSAREVCLVGSFNLWKVCETPLQRAPDGTWKVTVRLPRGRHEYMLVVDGQWQTDPTARLLVEDGFGQQNAVLVL
jgi:hypothetical protein